MRTTAHYSLPSIRRGYHTLVDTWGFDFSTPILSRVWSLTPFAAALLLTIAAVNAVCRGVSATPPIVTQIADVHNFLQEEKKQRRSFLFATIDQIAPIFNPVSVNEINQSLMTEARVTVSLHPVGFGQAVDLTLADLPDSECTNIAIHNFDFSTRFVDKDVVLPSREVPNCKNNTLTIRFN